MAANVSSGPVFESVNPARPSEMVGRYTKATPEQVTTAVEIAWAAQQQWAAHTASERATVIGGIAHAIARQTRDFIDLIVREQGKPTAQALVETRKSVEQFHFASQLAYLSEGATYPEEERGTFTYTLRVPLGVVVAITPWNFPLSLPARKLAPALAVGNAVVFKPSPITPAVGELLVRTCVDAGLPSGLLPLVHGDDSEAMACLVGHPYVRAVTFTGSDAVGSRLRRTVHEHARVQFELGGHNAAVVTGDADLQAAARDIAAAAFGQTGQTCTATDIVLVERPVFAEFTELLASRVSQLVAGPGDRKGMNLGPLAIPALRDRIDRLVDDAKARGARVIAEGRLADDVDPEGYWRRPVLLSGLPPNDPLLTNELFGPVVSAVPFDSLDEAIKLINDDVHGLVSAIHTTNLAAGHRFARETACGVIKVNGKTTGNGIAPPFGGWKASSSGAFPEGGRQAIDFFTDTKTIYLSF
jgi:acyl-CoA reductase-like NAD-dependent aldehyde dehydrogenase